MARTRLPIVPHLTPEQIYRRYRACRTGVEKTHWHLIWLLTRPEQPLAPAQAAAAVGLTAVWARALLKRWNAAGPDGLADRRAGANGGRGKLTTDQQIDLWAALQQPSPDGGLWTGPKVVAYVRGRWGVPVGKPTGWRWLRGLGFSLQVPRPCHPKGATAAEQQAWKRRHGSVDCRAAPAEPRQAGRVLGRG
jgi:transposase